VVSLACTNVDARPLRSDEPFMAKSPRGEALAKFVDKKLIDAV
jgi:hypothetical protein